MVKNSKKSKAAAPGNGSTAPENPETSPVVTAKSVKSAKTPAAKPAKAKSASKRASKAPAARKPRPAAVTRKTRPSRLVAISDEDIRIRAYFIAEKRMQSGLPGDSDHDWLEAHRQLREEAGQGA